LNQYNFICLIVEFDWILEQEKRGIEEVEKWRSGEVESDNEKEKEKEVGFWRGKCRGFFGQKNVNTFGSMDKACAYGA
jgi:hypothetical protein